VTSRPRGLAVPVLMLVLASCGGEPTGPGQVATPPEPIALGDTVSAELSVERATRTYLFHATATDSLVLFGQASSGYVSVTVTDSTTDQDIGFLSLDASTPRPLLTTFVHLQVTAGGTYLLRVRGAQPGVGAFRLAVVGVSPAPESRGAGAAIDSIEAGEALETGADIDEFSFSGQAGDELVAYLQALDAQPRQAMILSVWDGPASVLTAVRNDSTDAGIETNASQRFTLPHDGVYRVVLHGEYGWLVPGRTDAGRYRFEIRRVARAPEQVSPAATPGDTVGGELLDYNGDVDEFTFPVVQGRLYDVFLQDLSPSPSHLIYAEVLRDGVSHSGTGAEGGQALFRRGTGRFASEATGTETIRVYEVSGTPGPKPYRLYVYAIDTLPEALPPAQILDLALTGESLELPGDLDVFTLTLPSDTTINLAISKPAADSAQPVLTLTRVSDGGDVLTLYAPGATGGAGELTALTGELQLPAGTYRLRVDGGSGARDEYGGPYRVQSWRLSLEPEGVSPNLALGATVNESSSPLGDRDRYRFTGTEGQLVNLSLTGSSELVAYLMRSGVPGPSLIAEAVQGAFGSQTGRVHLPADGEYEIVTLPPNHGTNPSETGPYQLKLGGVDPAPEHLAATLPAAGGIVGESLDTPGDIDRFTITAAPGAEYEIVPQFATQQFYIRIQTLAPTGDAPDRTGIVLSPEYPLGRFVFPASGKLRLQVYEERNGFDNGYAVTGGYTVSFVPIDRAPETLPAAAPRNTTVQGESVGPIGDVDEFTFTGSAGEHIQAFFNTPQGIPGSSLTLEVVQVATGTVLGSVVSGNPVLDIHDQGTGQLMLPGNGTYLIRVRGTVDTSGVGAYEFLIGS
jgi:hypothetical protein